MLDTSDVRRFRRDLAAMVRKADDPEGFAQVVGLVDELHGLLREHAGDLNAEGYSSADLAGPLGVTRQAFHRRFLAAL